jgi:hypothetical protein
MTTSTQSPIRLDCSQTLIVVNCIEHDWWRAARFHKDDAWDAACGHEEREHSGDYRQRNARAHRVERARHAAHS